jgi:ABC-type polysaccharide/polyol phosphate transport system ATPase subunit
VKAIRFQNVSKKFVIGKHVTLKRKLSDLVDRAFHRNGDAARRGPQVLWALRDVSFEVEQGETLGLIGPNGSGKSTTLKLLAKITEADAGQVEVKGTVVPLIEVGAGFHQDLSGRENIYLNGSILGLKKADIDRQLDSIVEFAELPQFLDTPLKKYSSGMAVRLGFAIAVHINPDVLLVDEVLAVGDIRFQRKCTAKMKEIVNSGRTVVFVSHNMTAVQSLCKRCVLLFNGQVAAYGESQNVVNAYLTNAYTRGATAAAPSDTRTMICSFVKVECQDRSGKRVASVRHGEDLIVAVEYLLAQPVENGRIAVTIHGADGMTLYETDTRRHGRTLRLTAGPHRLRVLFPGLRLLPGIYSFTISLSDLDNTVFYGYAPNAMDFEVTSDRPDSPVGIVALPTEWELPGSS